MYFSEFVKGQVDNLRSNLSKNALLFLKEFSSHQRMSSYDTIGPFVKVVFPQALIKTVYEKNFIVAEAKRTIELAVQNLIMPEIIDVLVEGCQAKNIILAEYSMGYLQEVVKKMDEEYLISGNDSSKQLFFQLVAEFDGKRMKIKKGAESIFKDL